MSLSGTGVLWINSGVNDEQELAYDDYVQWYEEVHIRDVMNAAAAEPLPSARRYERVPAEGSSEDSTEASAHKSKKHPFLVVYDMPDLAFGSSEAFRQIPMGHPRLPDGGPIGRLATFHARFAREVSSSRGDKKKRGGILISEVFGDESGSQVSGCYVEESRYRQMAGWVRSTAYAIVGERQIGRNPAGGRAGVVERKGDDAVGNTTLILHEMDDEMQRAQRGTETREPGETKATKATKTTETTKATTTTKTGNMSDDIYGMRGEIGDSARGRRIELGVFRLVRTFDGRS
ncbi:aldehyde dehydrogenase [Ophiostoma piceae UAMH 11346]|uniref:Aldehyde dehydrogenase n=1 Tax=Ophiostoma piceae (strain UAMH 11346) TaxID=1262450 RepID=S3BNR9_OPHP1|nr:aldehyde dehydrogenase [Ophiostoma piceae UAMH 11346]